MFDYRIRTLRERFLRAAKESSFNQTFTASPTFNESDAAGNFLQEFYGRVDTRSGEMIEGERLRGSSWTRERLESAKRIS